MNRELYEQAKKELIRSKKALRAAKILLEKELFEDCVSRAYYAVLHAAKVALYMEGIEPDTHQGVRRSFGLHLVKEGKIEREYAKILIAEQEDREIGDYSIDIEIVGERAKERVNEAEQFVERIDQYLQKVVQKYENK